MLELHHTPGHAPDVYHIPHMPEEDPKPSELSLVQAPETNEAEPREDRFLVVYDEDQLYNGRLGFEPQAAALVRTYGPEGKDGGWYAEKMEPVPEGVDQADLEARNFRIATAAFQDSVGDIEEYKGPERHANVLPSYNIYVTPAGEAHAAAQQNGVPQS